MLGQKALVVGVVGAWLCSGVVPGAAFAAEQAPPLHRAVGEIVWLDLPMGKLQLYADQSRGGRTTSEYSITEHETRVTDRSDQQFLGIADLRAGQHITIESKDNGDERLAMKITVEPTSAPLFQHAEGTIESISASPGTFTLKETAAPGAGADEGMVSAFVFDPKEIVVMESPSLQPVRLDMQPGDFVKVDYVVRDGRRHARSMMRYAVIPGATTTTTTTTSTTTTTQ